MGVGTSAADGSMPSEVASGAAADLKIHTDPTIKLGVSIWPQATDWPSLRDTGVTADQAGWDSIWTWDHLMPMAETQDAPIFEGWSTLVAWAALTQTVTVGLMVGANTLRFPAYTAKLASTLDHISNGRAVLGLGAGWYAREHDAFGIPFGRSVGDRLDRMDEAVGVIRRLLAGERVTHAGANYQLDDATMRPLPLQRPLPILIGGSGRTKTLLTVAKYANAWNARGFLEDVQKAAAALDAHCQAIGRDPNSIERTVILPMIIRDDPDRAARELSRRLDHNGIEAITAEPVLLGSPGSIADALAPYVRLGFRHVIARLPAPHDLETVERVGELRTAIAARLDDRA